MKGIAKLLSSSLGLGYIPGAPGTYGAIFGSGVYALLHFYGGFPMEYYLIPGIVVFTMLGIYFCGILEEEWGHDPSKVVLDETIGQWIVYLFVPFSWMNLVIGLILFRIFDIWKPLGIRKIDQLDHPASVMLDDVLAGVYGWIVLQVIIYFI